MGHELPESRLATTAQDGSRVYVHPIAVHGFWSKLRTVTSWILIGIYLVLPWIYVNGKQVILLDLPKREFYLFGTMFYGHDGPLLIFVLLGFILFISFVTSVWGRVWCGYACPQTVFIERVFRRIEAWVEGGARRRQKLHASPWNAEKVLKKGLKWFLFLVVSLHIVHSGLGYFVGTHELIEITLNSPASNLTLFITMLVLTGIVLLDFGWFREQFCIIACPYGRFQSLAMDENSKIIAYDEKRGEPRRRAKLDKSQEGDCVNCKMCVKACPTGIDIREGLQMECIACTACIDACDEIMVKVSRPKGLIRYSSENELEGKKNKTNLRVYIYLILLVAVLLAAISQIQLRNDFKVQFLRGSKVPFQLVKTESDSSKNLVVNHFIAKVHSYKGSGKEVFLKIVGAETSKEVEIITPHELVSLNKDNLTLTYFFKFSPSILVGGEKKIRVSFIEKMTKEVIETKEVTLVGPIK